MARTRTTAVALLTGASALSAMANSGAAVAATIVLRPEERGVMVLVSSLSALVALVGPLGTGTALRSQLPRVDSDRHRISLLASYLWVTVGAAVVGAAVATVAVRLSAPAIDASLADLRLLVAVAVSTLAQILLLQSNELAFAVGDFQRGAAWNVASVIAGLAGLLIAVAISAQAWLLLLLQGTGLLGASLARWLALRRRGLIRLAAPSRRMQLALFRQGVPSLGLNIGLVLAQRADRYILGIVAGTAAVGIYSLAATLSGVASLVPLAIGQLSMRDAATRSLPTWPGGQVRAAVASAALTSVAVAIGGWLLVIPIFGQDFAPARHLIVPLLVAEICLAPYWVAARALVGGGWSRTAAMIGVANAVGATALYGVAIPIWGMVGAAAASSVLYGGLSLLTMVLLSRRLRGHAAPLPGITEGITMADRVPSTR
ncbi:lipopolysaccharide biosynthesis protein [Micromonospora sp. RTP1Z1]|uniref:lipopolysaccharide biosynthesis protein n=1 Tax=Micromonospora sp. RTP1Z1 TaxID=2994043 RepID=UPI0029C9A7A5|nr:oligosaccharide flippase family protein [Micromonospora sp. RTP1Z1]